MPPKFNGGVAGSAIVTAKFRVKLAPPPSFTVTTIVESPGTVGVPVMAPDAEMLRPVGNPVAENV